MMNELVELDFPRMSADHDHLNLIMSFNRFKEQEEQVCLLFVMGMNRWKRENQGDLEILRTLLDFIRHQIFLSDIAGISQTFQTKEPFLQPEIAVSSSAASSAVSPSLARKV